MKINYKIQDKFDFSIFISVMILLGIGLVAIYSATLNHPIAGNNFNKQLFYIFISMGVLFLAYIIPLRIFRTSAFPAYIVTTGLLILVLLVGRGIKGANSWLTIGSFGIQPSEFGKITLIFLLSYFLGEKKRDINTVKDISITLLIMLVPVVFILLQPDMGTVIIYMFITLVMIFWRGISLFSLFVVLSPLVVSFSSIFGTSIFIISLVTVLVFLIFFRRDIFLSAVVFVINMASGFFFEYIFNMLKPHQQKRIEAFIDPSADPLNTGYNALQVKVAIGSGGIWGKGFLQGNQTHLRFIPEQWTDFIYCVIGEEFGFIGSVITIILFMIFMLRILKLTSYTKDYFNSLVLIGILSYFFIHFSINIGMNIGIIPVIGVPLPFLSYGGSSLLVSMFLVGIILNIYKSRKQYT